MDISVVILNYKSEHYLFSCIASLRKHLLGISYEILIINNDPEPITSIAPAKELRIIENNLNEGFAQACNKAASQARGKILFFLNPDTEILSGNIAELVTALQNSAVGVVSPQLVTPSGEIQPWSAGYNITLGEVLRNNLGLVRSKKLWQPESLAQPDWTSGAALAIRRTLFQKIGGFDSHFFMYFEDVDLCKRVRQAAKTIQLLRSVQVLHLGGQSAHNLRSQKQYYYASQDYYFKKHFGSLALLILKSLRELSLLFKKTQS